MGNRVAKWKAEVDELLARAAELSAEHQVELERFMHGAYAAYLEARPGMAEEIADRQLAEQLDEIRKAGRMASA